MLNFDDERLEEIIDSTENLEMKRALAIKMFFSDFPVAKISKLLNVSAAFVSQWKIIYEHQGARALKVGYHGRSGFLTEPQRLQVLWHLKDPPHYGVAALQDDLERQFGVVYSSRQSYYDLLKASGLTWHRTQAANPQRDARQVWEKRQAIKKTRNPSNGNPFW